MYSGLYLEIYSTTNYVNACCHGAEEEGENWWMSEASTMFGASLTAATSTVLQSELTSCQELLELEPDNKCTCSIPFHRMYDHVILTPSRVHSHHGTAHASTRPSAELCRHFQVSAHALLSRLIQRGLL